MFFKNKNAQEQTNKETKDKKKKSKKLIDYKSISKPHTTPQIMKEFFQECNDDGIMKIDENLYSVCFEYQDISFAKAKREEQISILLKYVEFLNAHSVNENIQVCHTGAIVDIEEYKQKFMIPENESNSETSEKITKELNKLISGCLGSKTQEICELRLITMSTKADSFEEAKDIFLEYQFKLEEFLKKLNSKVRRYTNTERLELLYNIFNLDTLKNKIQDKDIEKYANENNLTLYDVLAPKEDVSFKNKSYVKIGNEKYIRIICVEKLPKSITPQFYNDITTIENANVIVTENITPTDPSKVIEKLNKKISGLKTERLNKVKRANRNHYDYNYVRDDKLENNIENLVQLRNALTKKKQKLFEKSTIIGIIANSEKELKLITEKVKGLAAKHIITLRTLDWQQLEGLKNLLPFGYNTLQFQRSLTSEACGTSVPFNTKKLNQPYALWYGRDLVTKKIVSADRKQLTNGNGVILGTSGGGKSFFAKMNVEQIYLRYPKDDIIIIDPDSEFSNIVNALGGQEIFISNQTKTYINPFDFSIDYVAENEDPIKTKIEYILAFIESIIGEKGLTGAEISIIDRCTKNILEDYLYANGKEPDFKVFYEELKKCQEKEAKNLVLILERYVSGGMDIFAQKTNIEIHNRLVSFNISKLVSSMKTTGYLIILEHIMNRLVENRKLGKDTWIFIDEFHILLQNKLSAERIAMIYKICRKYNGLPTILTQNIEDVLNNENGRKILANSEFAAIFRQSSLDIEAICSIFDISPKQREYIEDSPAGQGVLVFGDDKAIIENNVPEDYYIYKLNQTSNRQKSRI